MDSFSGLSWGGGQDAGTKKKLERMSLAERQQYLAHNPKANTNANSNGYSNGGASSWTGIDLLTNTAASQTSFSSKSSLNGSLGGSLSGSLLDISDIGASQPVNKSPKVYKPSQKTNGTLLDIDDFGSTSTTDGPSGSTDQSSSNKADIYEPEPEPEEDPFDVFNRPVQPQQQQPSSETPSEPVSTGFSGQQPFEPAADSYSSSQSSSSISMSRDSSLPREREHRHEPVVSDPRLDRAIAELVDMGFTAEQSREALDQTDNGHDVRQAIDYIMTEAHRKATGKPPLSRNSSDERRPSRRTAATSHSALQGDLSAQELGKIAQDLSSQLFTKASSFLNQGRKNLAKAIDQYSQGSSSHGGKNSGMPAWMDEHNRDTLRTEFQDVISRSREEVMKAERLKELQKERRQNDRHQKDAEMDELTQEAQFLQVDSRPRPRSSQNRTDANVDLDNNPDASHSDPVLSSEDRRQRLARIPRAGETRPSRFDFASRDSHRDSSSQSSGYHPSNQNQPTLSQKFKDSGASDEMPARRRAPRDRKETNGTGTPAAARPVPRPAVSISSTALDMANMARASGTEAFKRGDFPKALELYSQALESVPAKHVLRTVLLSNRAACNMKVGDTQAVLQDVEEGLTIIGPSLGAGEEAEPGKSLKDIWGKLVQKRAEAYEHNEKFQQSLESWDLLLNNGFSNAVSLAGRRRCQQALQPKPKVQPPKPKPTSTPTSTQSSGPTSAAGKAAVDRVKRANISAAQAEAERVNLADTVDQKLTNWKHGKEDNLRTLLASLDLILWPELQWKKVSMAELVLPKKVKLVYMKAVAKTHPDKVPVNATTEQKMISESVFVTLNKAWDAFKVENDL